MHFPATTSRCQTVVTIQSSSNSPFKACSGQFFSIIFIFDTKRFGLPSRKSLTVWNGCAIPFCSRYTGCTRSRYIRACFSLFNRFLSLRFSRRSSWSWRLLCVVTIAAGKLSPAIDLGLHPRQTLNRSFFVCTGNRPAQFAHVCDVKYSSTILTTE